MRKPILFVLFATSLWWYIYRSENINFKGLKRLMVSIKMAIIIALALLGGPTGVSAKSEADGFTSPQAKTEISRKGLFKSSSGMYGTNIDNSGGFGSPWDNNDANSEAKPIKKNVEKSIEHPYYHQPVQKQDDESDFDKQCPVNERLEIAVSKDGSMTKVRASKVWNKGLHIPEFLSKNRLKSKFDVTKVKDLEYEDRLNYLRNKDNLPDEVVFETQDKIVEFLLAEDTILVPGFLGARKIRGTIFINLRLNQFGFRDEGSYEYRTVGSMSDNKIRKIAESDFHLFPTAGE